MKISDAIAIQASHAPASAVRSRNAALVKGRYGDFDSFAANFNPSRQQSVMQHLGTVMRRWRGYPSLVQCEQAYGGDNMAAWLVLQLRGLFAKGEEPEEIKRTAVAILSTPEFRPLKVTELMAFAARFYTGAFGKVYGKATGTDIMEALHKFCVWLAAEKTRYDEEQRNAEREEWAKTAVTWEQYARQNGMEGKSIAEVLSEAEHGSGK